MEEGGENKRKGKEKEIEGEEWRGRKERRGRRGGGGESEKDGKRGDISPLQLCHFKTIYDPAEASSCPQLELQH